MDIPDCMTAEEMRLATLANEHLDMLSCSVWLDFKKGLSVERATAILVVQG